MRVFIDAHLARAHIDGIGRYLIGLITGLSCIDKENEYTIVCASDILEDHPLRTLDAPNFNKYWVDFNLPLAWKQQRQIAPLIRKEKPDIYHHPHFDLPFGISCPTVITIHDLKFIHDHTLFKKFTRAKSFYMKHMMKSSVKRADRVLTVSEFTRDDIISAFHLKKANKIETVYHGVDPVITGIEGITDAKSIYNKYGINYPYILFVGEKKTHKNIVRMIEAYKRARDEGNIPHKLLLVGRTYPRYQEHFRKVEELALQDDVIFIEYPPDHEIAQFYKGADMFLFPSLYEGFGLPVLEAMQNGLPVIASDITALPEVVGDAGMIVDPFNPGAIADAIVKLAKDTDFKNTLIQKGMERVKQFTWEKCARETLTAYESVIIKQ